MPEINVHPKLFPDLIVDPLADGSAVLLHPSEPRWALANPTGRAIIPLLDGSRPTDQVAAEVAGLYSLPVESVLGDVEAFIRSLESAGLMESAPLPPVKPERRRKSHSMTIYVTEQCNLRCSHCAIVEGRMPDSRLTPDDIRHLIDQFMGTYPTDGTISFLGGEPLLHPHCLELLEYASAKAHGTSIATNALLVTEETAARIAKLPTEVQVSLDGATAATHELIRGKNTWDRTWIGIERLVKAGVGRRLTIATTLTKGALGEVQALVDRAAQLGVGTIRFLQLNRTLAAKTNWESIAPDDAELMGVTEHLLFDVAPKAPAGLRIVATFPGFVPDVQPGQEHWCPLGETAIVDSQGMVYTCPSLEVSEVTLGNALSEELDVLLTGPRAAEARQAMLERRFKVEACRACAWRNFCQGGCTAYMAHRSGSLLINDQFCDFRRHLYRRWAVERCKATG